MNSNFVFIGFLDVFDFYIDSVRFIFDNFFMIKVILIFIGFCYIVFDYYWFLIKYEGYWNLYKIRRSRFLNFIFIFLIVKNFIEL